MDDNRLDEMVFRSLKGRTTKSEEAFLTAWRRFSPENEARYRELAALLTTALAALQAGEMRARPRSSDIIRDAERTREPRRPVPWHLRRVGRGTWLWAGMVAAGIVLLLLAGGIHRRQLVPRTSPTEFVTGLEEFATVRLRDGSVVQIAPQSRLRVHEAAGREVSLEGRAYFAVAKREGSSFPHSVNLRLDLHKSMS
jgi:ferric-dicitrate binding protein FerR (iron transport regulator)